MTTTTAPPTPDDRVARLSTASVRKVLEPEELFDWSSLGRDQVIGDELLTTRGLDLDLPPDVTSFEVPGDFTDLGDEAKFEILVRADNGNQTAVESCFTLL